MFFASANSATTATALKVAQAAWLGVLSTAKAARLGALTATQSAWIGFLMATQAAWIAAGVGHVKAVALGALAVGAAAGAARSRGQLVVDDISIAKEVNCF